MPADPALRTIPESLETLPLEARPNIDDLITEDDTPVDNIFSEKQQRLLTESLYSSWKGPGDGRSFLALANVGLFYAVRRPPLVPDVMLSLDVQASSEDIWARRNRSYFVWEFGKPPEVVIEIVSNQEGEETGRKWREYARIGVTYYVIFDPLKYLQSDPLHIYVLREKEYMGMNDNWLPAVELGLTLWSGTYEGLAETWLRWCDQEGNLIPTGAERARQAERELERLATRLRELESEEQ